MSHKVEVVSKRRSKVGEGPYWDSVTGTLLYVDITGGDVCRLNPETQQAEERHFEDFASVVLPMHTGGQDLLVALGTRLVKLDYSTGEFKELSKIENEGKILRFNDGKCDRAGRLWIGTMAIEPVNGVFPMHKGALYKAGKDFQLYKQVDRVSISNGLAWTADNRTMFFNDSLLRRVDAFDYNDGIISRRRTVAKFADEDGLPDGMTIDQTGHLWIAFFDGSKIIELDPETGTTLRTIKFPIPQITSCCFGGPNYNDLYVTSASVNVLEPLETPALAGCIFKVSGLGVQGLPESKVQPRI